LTAALPQTSSRSVSWPRLFAALLFLDAIYQLGIRHQPLAHVAWLAPLDAAAYTAIFFVTSRFDLARLTIAYLALPYFLFLPTWLNLPTAAVALAILGFGLARHAVGMTRPGGAEQAARWQDALAFVAVLVWVNLSGSGGYGYQAADHELHNGRLQDLIEYAWPVRYGKDQNLILYVGYYLPAAMFGKATDFTSALRAMYPWTVFGVALVMRWLAVLTGRRLTLVLVLIFALFGPLDIIGYSFGWLRGGDGASWLQPLLRESDHLDFWASDYLGFFLGSFPSNTFQLFWSPHQVVSGWLVMALITHLFEERRPWHSAFVYALLCLWAPVMMVTLFPFAAVAAVYAAREAPRKSDLLADAIATGALVVLFVIFYAGGSALENPSLWTLSTFDVSAKWDGLLLFYLSTWGIYVAALLASPMPIDRRQRVWFYCLLLTLLVLPLRTYGAYNDLLCRGSAPLMFLLLVFLLRRMRDAGGIASVRGLLFAVSLLLGSGSALLQMHIAWKHYGETRRPITVPKYLYARENLGPDDSFFARYLRKRIPASDASVRRLSL
jgi:hypothetical protein